MFHLRIVLVAAAIAAALALNGTAWGARVASGKVVDANGNPLANVPVYLYNETNNAVSQTLDAVASATTASDGTYASTWQ